MFVKSEVYYDKNTIETILFYYLLFQIYFMLELNEETTSRPSEEAGRGIHVGFPVNRFILNLVWEEGGRVRYKLLLKESSIFVGFEVLTVMVMNSSLFWDITSCSPLKINLTFGGTCRLHHHGRRVSQAKNQREGCSNCVVIPLKLKLFSSIFYD
jgi:hypothetical protein